MDCPEAEIAMQKAIDNLSTMSMPASHEAGQISQFLMLGGWCRIWMVSGTCKFVGSLSRHLVCTGMLPKTRVFYRKTPILVVVMPICYISLRAHRVSSHSKRVFFHPNLSSTMSAHEFPKHGGENVVEAYSPYLSLFGDRGRKLVYRFRFINFLKNAEMPLVGQSRLSCRSKKLPNTSWSWQNT